MLENISSPLDRDQVTLQAAALAEHLQRAGVAWLPRPHQPTVDELKTRLFSSPAASPTAAAVPTAESASATAASRPETPPPAGTAPQLEKNIAATSSPPPAADVSRPAADTSPDAADTSLAARAMPYPGADLPLATRAQELTQLAQQVAGCQKCPQLARCRTQTVFGEGHAEARVVFMGDAPGADEDRAGRPFVDQAGQLLTKMIEACQFARQDVYILNAVKCRPPGDRHPEAKEIANCRPYFEQQLQRIRPEYIVCLGAVSGQALLDSKLSVGRLRGRFHPYFSSKVVVTYHPAYLLRNPAAKRAAWDDLQMMLRDAGLL